MHLHQGFGPLGPLAQLRVLSLELPRAIVSSYDYDRNGRVARIDDSRWGRTDYADDPLGQLIEAQRAGGRYHEVFEEDLPQSSRRSVSSQS